MQQEDKCPKCGGGMRLGTQSTWNRVFSAVITEVVYRCENADCISVLGEDCEEVMEKFRIVSIAYRSADSRSEG